MEVSSDVECVVHRAVILSPEHHNDITRLDVIILTRCCELHGLAPVVHSDDRRQGELSLDPLLQTLDAAVQSHLLEFEFVPLDVLDPQIKGWG